jgi:2'-5' RNA ligase
MRKRRIFIAITISKQLQAEILRWSQKYKKLPVRWLAGKNLHITLVPPWHEIDIENQIFKIKKIKAEPFIIEFTKVTFGPNPNQPRLIWSIAKAQPQIFHLKNKLEMIFPEHKKIQRDFITHLTIARFDNKKFSSFPIKKIDEDVLWQDEVNSFVLMESRLSPKGADYEILETFKL